MIVVRRSNLGYTWAWRSALTEAEIPSGLLYASASQALDDARCYFIGGTPVPALIYTR